MNSFVWLVVLAAILSSFPRNSFGSVLRLKTKELIETGDVRQATDREASPLHHRHHHHSNNRRTKMPEDLEESLSQNLGHMARGPRGRRQSDFHMLRRQTRHRKRFLRILAIIQTYGMPSTDRNVKYNQCVLDGIVAYGKPNKIFLDLCAKIRRGKK